jgi:hypothetical protein
MKVKLSGRPTTNPFNLEPGQTFKHNEKVFLATPYMKNEAGKTINAVSLATGAFFCFEEDTIVERIHGTFVEDDLSAVEEDL